MPERKIFENKSKINWSLHILINGTEQYLIENQPSRHTEPIHGVPIITYRIVGKFGEFDKSSMIRQTKIIQISTYNL